MSRVLPAILFLLSISPATARETLTLEGLAPVRIGMTLHQVEKSLGTKLTLSGDASGDAAVYSQTSRPGDEKTWYMFEQYRLTRIDTINIAIATADGAKVGDTEVTLKRLYGKRAVFSVHPYLGDEGHYVTVSYPKRKLIFETDHGKVTSFRIGIPGAAELIEGCA